MRRSGGPPETRTPDPLIKSPYLILTPARHCQNEPDISGISHGSSRLSALFTAVIGHSTRTKGGQKKRPPMSLGGLFRLCGCRVTRSAPTIISGGEAGAYGSNENTRLAHLRNGCQLPTLTAHRLRRRPKLFSRTSPPFPTLTGGSQRNNGPLIVNQTCWCKPLGTLLFFSSVRELSVSSTRGDGNGKPAIYRGGARALPLVWARSLQSMCSR